MRALGFRAVLQLALAACVGAWRGGSCPVGADPTATPSILLPGFAKCGTTTLFDLKHVAGRAAPTPAVIVGARHKEANFFDSRSCGFARRSRCASPKHAGCSARAYATCFPARNATMRGGARELTLDASPGYAFSMELQPGGAIISAALQLGRLSACTLQIWLLREPLERIESSWNYRRDVLRTSVGWQCSLAQALKAELVYLDSPAGAGLVRRMLGGRTPSGDGPAAGRAFAMARSSGVRPIAGSGCVLAPRDKIVLQSLYYPQLLHFLDASRASRGRALALQSEHFFADPAGVVARVVGPFVHGAGAQVPDAADGTAGDAVRVARQRGSARSLRALEPLRSSLAHSNPSVHRRHGLNKVSLRCKLVCTFAPFNAALNQLLATDERIVAYPVVRPRASLARRLRALPVPSDPSAGSPWWPDALHHPECIERRPPDVPALNCSSRPFL
ncbi:hypothetical protein KFE25_004253 [Diacronema lutheri]|uniref:Sulfotransferase domain-containing protein n=1 Tax=Diacronema lutheri TaxID=2081491 RepID=A0A8J6C310_DIALT|nr:hypothetical protein KFE25_004253 [Diacronema lutheri]